MGKRQFVNAMAAAAAAAAEAMATVQTEQSGGEVEQRKRQNFGVPNREDFASRADYRRAVAKFKKGEVYW